MGSKVKRANNQTEITVVSNLIFDPFKNENHLHVFQALLDDYVQSKGLTYDKSLVKTTIKNEGGMFAVLYTIVGYDCDQVSTMIKKQNIQRDPTEWIPKASNVFKFLVTNKNSSTACRFS
ncbi:hypothetical protein OESDEN_22076 [Oesophagostomum dentatum]|uniref:Uncharacterized protein n=1 Tax=Oesophagostomum dentatum TaxID=61180 RepID=A0A0B1S034_OESDE|nr:hypothetical protein OESDEN_22076 [Oesophagostomum dentatum]